MNIDGLGEKIVDQLIEQSLVQDVADLYLLKLDKVASHSSASRKNPRKISSTKSKPARKTAWRA